MLPWILISALFIIVPSLILLNSPLTMGLIILMMAFTISTLYASLLSSWYAFLIFLIYIGGMLVMFSYFIALIPNQKTLVLPTQLILLLMPLTLSIFTMLNMPCSIQMPSLLQFLYLPLNTPIFILLALLLLLIMVIIVKITDIFKGPLRVFSYV